MSLPRISIITPSFNQGQYIEETILSVLNQGYPNLEYIVIDGGSTDSTKEVLSKYSERISYWVSEPDKGQSDAINKGLKRATGDIVAWLNSDDCYEPDALHEVAAQFQSAPDAGIVIGKVLNVFANGKEEIHDNNFEPVDFMSRVAIHQPGTFWKRELNEQFGYLDPSFYYLMDQDLWVRIFFNAKCIRTDKVLARFRIHDEAKTGNNPLGLYDDFRRIFSRLLNSVPDNSYKQRAIELGIYNNEGNIRFPMAYPPSADQLQQIFGNNVWNAILLEYRRGDIGKVNKLLIASMGKGHMVSKWLMLLKNNLGIGKLKHQTK